MGMGRGRRILIVDDDAEIRRVIARLLGGRWETVEVATRGEALRALELDGTFVGLVQDKVLPDGNGLDVVDRYERLRPAARVLVITAFDEHDFANDLVRREILYARKPFDNDQIVAFGRRLLADEHLPDEHVARALLRMADAGRLPLRETEILCLATRHHTQGDIAEKFGTSVETVGKQVCNMLVRLRDAKIKADSLADLVFALHSAARREEAG